MQFGRIQTAQAPDYSKHHPKSSKVNTTFIPGHQFQTSQNNSLSPSSASALRLPAHSQCVDSNRAGRGCRGCCALYRRIRISLPLLPHSDNGRWGCSVRRRRCRCCRRFFAANHSPPPALDTAQHGNLLSELLSAPSHSSAVREAEMEQYLVSPVVVFARQTNRPARRCWPDKVPAALGWCLGRRAV